MFDENLKFDGFTMKQWDRALYDFCNGPPTLDRPAAEISARAQLIFLMRQHIEQESQKEKELEDNIIVGARAGSKYPEFIQFQLHAWRNFYRGFGINFDIEKVTIPEHSEGFNSLVVIAPKMRPQSALNICQSLFECQGYTNNRLDILSIVEERNSLQQPYAVWVKGGEEADEELANCSARYLSKNKIICMSLTERLLFGAKYFDETGEYLDIKKITLCAGSRARRGREKTIPAVHWNNTDNSMIISWRFDDARKEILRARRVIV